MSIITTSARAANRAARAERRDEIVGRWRSRVGLRSLDDFISKEERTPAQLTYGLLHLADGWVPLEDLIAELPEKEITRELLGYLLRVIQLKEMPYDEYLQSPEWKRAAKNAKKKYRGRCGLDASHVAVDAHHRTYDRRGRELPDDLIPLCRECHERFHKR